MRKHAFHLTLSAAILFILTACGGNNYIYTTQVQALPQQQYIPDAVAYHQPDTISYGRQLAKEFLLGYISLFSLGYYEDGNFFVWDYHNERSATFDYIPLVYVVYGSPTNFHLICCRNLGRRRVIQICGWSISRYGTWLVSAVLY